MKTALSFEDAIDLFVADKKAQGIAAATLKSYRNMLWYIWRPELPEDLRDITDQVLKDVVRSWASTEVSRNTIRSYTATMQSFLSWARTNGLSDAKIRLFKGEETVPECYSAAELKLLLKRPNLKTCTFAEYRTWVIINLLVNDGCRASTVVAIRNQDVDLEGGVIYLRHMKKRRSITIPLSDSMVTILRQYMAIRKGEPSDPLFPTEYGKPLTTDGLGTAVDRYNRKRGVHRTGLHKFRHTFARMYLVDCDGDPLRLQKILGHTTLEMTKHYAKLFDADIVKDRNEKSPLEKLKGSDRIRMK